MSGDHNMHCSANQPDKETPLALRLAAELDEEHMYFPDDNNKRIAAELRRLYALNKEWESKAATWMASPEARQRLDGYRELAQRVNALETLNVELVAALEDVEYLLEKGWRGDPVLVEVRAALAKAKGESNE